jgi:ribonuclease Z
VKITFLGTSHGDPTAERYNVSFLLEAGEAGYLFDCGSPATASLVRRGFDFGKLRAVFISHMHLDHCADLPNLLKHLIKHKLEPHACLPDPAAVSPVDSLLRLAYPVPPGIKVMYQIIEPGRFFADGNVSVTAVPTDHGRGSFPSFAFVIEAAGKKILYTGDLSASLDDFPVRAAEEADLVICELTHALPEVTENKLRSLALKRVVFTHIGPRYEKAGILTLPQGLPFAVSAASDGDVLRLE